PDDRAAPLRAGATGARGTPAQWTDALALSVWQLAAQSGASRSVRTAHQRQSMRLPGVLSRSLPAAALVGQELLLRVRDAGQVGRGPPALRGGSDRDHLPRPP